MSEQAREQRVAHPYDVYILGLGIVGCRQITREAESALRRCRKAFVLPNEYAVYDCLQQLGPELVALDYLYEPPGKERNQVYQEMADVVLTAARETQPVAFACEGHPLLYCTPARLIRDIGREQGLRIKVYPGISSWDTLFVDLELDPGPAGLQVFEATIALLYRYTLQADVPCLLLQVGALETGLFAPDPSKPARFQRLKQYLLGFYPPDHELVFAASATNPIARPKLVRLPLAEIECIADTPHGVMTLYIPPLSRRPVADLALAELIGSATHLRSISTTPDRGHA